jgi:hypothetical protein
MDPNQIGAGLPGGMTPEDLLRQMDQQYAQAFNQVLQSFTKEMVSEIMSAMQDAMFEGDSG